MAGATTTTKPPKDSVMGKKNQLLNAILATFPELRASGTGPPKFPKIEKAVEANRLNRHAGDIYEDLEKAGIGEGTMAKLHKALAGEPL